MNPNLHESDPNLHEMAPKTTMNRPNQHHCVQAPKRVAFSGFTMIKFTVELSRGADGAAPPVLGISMKTTFPAVSPRREGGLQFFPAKTLTFWVVFEGIARTDRTARS